MWGKDGVGNTNREDVAFSLKDLKGSEVWRKVLGFGWMIRVSPGATSLSPKLRL